MSTPRIVAVAHAIAVLHSTAAACAEAQTLTYSTNGDTALAALIEEAVERNPQLRAARLEWVAAEARIPQASVLPNPTVSFTQHVLGPQTRVGPQFSNISLSQSMPWFGTLADRAAMAESESAIRGESYQALRAEIVRRVKLAWYDLIYLDRALRVTGEEEELLRHYESLARARYSQGSGQLQEAVKLQAEITRVLNRRQELLQQRTDTEALLNHLTARQIGAAIAPVLDVGYRPQDPIDAETLQEIGLAVRPEIAAARMGVERSRHAVSLANRRSRPGLTVGIAWGAVLPRRDDPGLALPPAGNGRDHFSLTLGASIPFSRTANRAAVEEASAKLAAAEETYRDLTAGAAMGVRTAAFRLETVARQLDLFERALIPQAEHALRTTEEAYSTGVTGVVELLDSERLLLDVRLGFARLQSDYMKASAEMERATGSPFPTSAGNDGTSAGGPTFLVGSGSKEVGS